MSSFYRVISLLSARVRNPRLLLVIRADITSRTKNTGQNYGGTTGLLHVLGCLGTAPEQAVLILVTTPVNEGLIERGGNLEQILNN